jgi:hypothetical protein
VSTIKVDTLTDTSGNSIPYMKGAVLQTVVHQETGATTFTASGTSDKILLASGAADSTSHLSLSITPKSTSSKILLTASIFFEGDQDNYVYLWSFYRDSTKLAAPIAGSNRRSGIAMTATSYHAADASSTPDCVNYHYYDSPSTTSAITYACSFNHQTSGAIAYLNQTVNASDGGDNERGISILIAQEIGG